MFSFLFCLHIVPLIVERTSLYFTFDNAVATVTVVNPVIIGTSRIRSVEENVVVVGFTKEVLNE